MFRSKQGRSSSVPVEPIPHTCHGGQSPAGGTRCSGSSQHAPGGCWYSHRCTDASTSACHTQGLQWSRAEVRAVPRAEPANARTWPWDSSRIPGGNRAELVLGSSSPYSLSRLVLKGLDKNRIRDRPSTGQRSSSERLWLHHRAKLTMQH